MVAWRYNISLLVLKKIFHEWAQRNIFFNTRREISYLRGAMQYPLYMFLAVFVSASTIQLSLRAVWLILSLEGLFVGSKGGNTLEKNGVHFHHMKVNNVSVISFIDKCLMRSFQDEKKKKKRRKKCTWRRWCRWYISVSTVTWVTYS